ncbi:MAG: hypothetical protein HOY79_16350 [Streptomyces sp.]|nr:hypothetical protein [Streptomyces sp.]
MTDTPRPHATARERAPESAGGSGGATLGAAAPGLTSGQTASAAGRNAAATAPQAADCVLTPEQTEGPYHLSLETVRRTSDAWPTHATPEPDWSP